MFAPVESTAISGGSAEHHLTRPSDPSVAQVGEILPRLGITKRRFKQVEPICLVREQRASGRQELAFNARPFVLCGLPLRRPLKDQLTHSRHSGKFFLQILGHPDYGLPTVRADCTCVPLAFGMGRNISSLPPAARSAI